MSALATSLQAWFTDRLVGQRHASPNTIAAYRDTWRLLLQFIQSQNGTQPFRLDIADLNRRAQPAQPHRTRAHPHRRSLGTGTGHRLTWALTR